MKKNRFVLLLSLGDSLISLSYLNQLDKDIVILGTRHTENIAKLIDVNKKVDVEIVFDDIPAFYDIKKRGIFKAVLDFYRFINYLKVNKIDSLVFEKNDFRTSILSLLTNIEVYHQDDKNNKIYNYRQKLIENIFQKKIDLGTYTLKLKQPKVIVINPLTREEYRNIKHEHLKFMIDILNKNHYEIYLIDIEKKYQNFKNSVQYYLTNTTLQDVKNLINRCDLYIGGDSFLIHLAYYLKRNYFIFFYRENDDFLPPNILEDFYIKINESIDLNSVLEKKFKNIGLVR